MSTYEPGTLNEIQSWVSSRIESQDLFRICGNCARRLTPVSGNSDTISSDILSLKNLNKTRFFDPEDMVGGVEAGMSIRTLQKNAGREKYTAASKSLVFRFLCGRCSSLQRFWTQPHVYGRTQGLYNRY